jgi:hypothetical protein
VDGVLTPGEFADAVRKGMGRAVLAVNGPVSQEFENIILAACCEDQRHDSQLEDNRTGYLMDLVDRAGIAEKVQSIVLEPVDESLDDWDRLQRIRMIGQFARRSNPQALDILRKLALNMDTDSWEALAGVGDIEWLVHNVLPSMPLDEKWRAGSWLDENPGLPEDVSEALRAADQELEPVRAKNQMESQNRELISFEEALKAIETGLRYVPGLRLLAPTLSKDQVLQVAKLWLREQDLSRANNYLGLIEGQPLPLPVREIIDLVNKGNPPWRFEEIVSRYEHPLVREFGLDLISRREPVYRGYLCLCKSYQAEDLPRMVECLDRFLALSSDDLHGLGMDLRSLVKDMKPEERLPFMLWSYEHTPCSACRAWSAEFLIGDGTLPDAYRQEILFDADSHARELATKSTR